jgi:DNA-binding IclR family transcriptional regulator
LAAPIFNNNDKPAAALSVSGNAKNFKGKKQSRLADLLMETAGEINREMRLF